MATVEERVSYAEAKMEEHSRTLADLRSLIIALEQKMERRFEAIDRRFEAVERRFDQMDRRFMWVIGIQFSTLLTMIALLLRR